MVAQLLLAVLCAGPSPSDQLVQLHRTAEKRLQALFVVSGPPRPEAQATADDVTALRSAISGARDSIVECETFAAKNAEALKPYRLSLTPHLKDPDELRQMRATLDELLRMLAGPKDVPAVKARLAEHVAAKQLKKVEVEATVNLKALRVAEMSLYQERDSYSADLQEVGFAPEACSGGARAEVPDSTWIAGCHYIYRVQVRGTCPDCSYEAVARGVADPVKGVSYSMTNRDSEPTRSKSTAR